MAEGASRAKGVLGGLGHRQSCAWLPPCGPWRRLTFWPMPNLSRLWRKAGLPNRASPGHRLWWLPSGITGGGGGGGGGDWGAGHTGRLLLAGGGLATRGPKAAAARCGHRRGLAAPGAHNRAGLEAEGPGSGDVVAGGHGVGDVGGDGLGVGRVGRRFLAFAVGRTAGSYCTSPATPFPPRGQTGGVGPVLRGPRQGGMGGEDNGA